MTPGEADPLAVFRRRLQRLYASARKPTYRTLEAHAAQEGNSLYTSTVSDLLNGPSTPRWDTVETFVRACVRYAQSHQVVLDAAQIDLSRWHDEYQAMRSAVDEKSTPKAARRAPAVVPAQLPAAAAFTGRTEHLAALDKWLSADSAVGRPATLVISAIDGTAGVGKTALAVHWAYQVADRFPDGQLYVNLRGFDPSGQMLDPGTALRGFLGALGVPNAQLPSDMDAQTSLYRSLLAGRRMLIVLDNARDSAHVRPLLPGRSECLVMVTSRNQLTGLVAEHGAHPITLDVLTAGESRDLLAQRLGIDRVAAEPDAVAEIIARCARLPLALAVVAARAAARPGFSLAAIAGQLRDAGTGLDSFVDTDPQTDMRTVFSWSYQALSEPAAALFSLLGSHPGPDAGLRGVAGLAGITPAEAAGRLAELERAHLISQPVPGRYALHDLLRAYATELGSESDQHAAVHRVLDHYLHTAHEAALLLEPHREELPLPPPVAGVSPEQPADVTAALAWYAAEHHVLLAAIDQAVADGFDTHVWQLARSVTDYLQRRGHWQEQAAIHRAALAAAIRLGDRRTEARACRHLARAEILLGRFDDAYAHYEQAVQLSRTLADHSGEAHALMNLANLVERNERFTEALGHARRALELFTVAGNRDGQARCHNMIGWYQTSLGDHAAAQESCERALAMHRELDDEWGAGATLDSLGYIHHRRGAYAEAANYYAQAVELIQARGDRFVEATVLSHLAETVQCLGDRPAAAEVWSRALVIFEELGHAEAVRVRAALDALTA